MLQFHDTTTSSNSIYTSLPHSNSFDKYLKTPHVVNYHSPKSHPSNTINNNISPYFKVLNTYANRNMYFGDTLINNDNAISRVVLYSINGLKLSSYTHKPEVIYDFSQTYGNRYNTHGGN